MFTLTNTTSEESINISLEEFGILKACVMHSISSYAKELKLVEDNKHASVERVNLEQRLLKREDVLVKLNEIL